MGKNRNAHKVLVRKPQEEKNLEDQELDGTKY